MIPATLRSFLALYRRRPIVSTVIVLSVAIGIATTLTATSVADALLVRPLSFDPVGDVVALHGRPLDRPDIQRGGASPADFLDWKSRSSSFAAIAAYNSYEGSFQGKGDAIRVTVGTVTDGLTDVLRLRPALGRLFAAEDFVGPPGTVVLTHRFWRDHLASDSSILNTSVIVNGRPRLVIGVLPEMLPEYPAGFALWSPLRVEPGATRSATFLRVVARLRGDVSPGRARAEMSAIASQLAKEYPQTNAARGIGVENLRDAIAGPVTPMLTLIGAVLLMILLVVCANVGLLLLAAAQARRRELAVRLAIGASMRQLGAQLVSESLSFAAVGGAIGIALVPLLTRLLVRFYPGELPRASELGINVPVLVAALVMVFATALVASLPALRRAQGVDLTRDLANGSRASMRTGRGTAALIVSQVAVTLALMFCGSVLIRAFFTISSVRPGFRADGLLTFNLATPPARYPDLARYQAFYDQLYARIEQLPDVRAVGGSSLLPFAPGNLDEYIIREGYASTPDKLLASTQWVTPGYVDALNLPILRGRGLAATDRDSIAPPIVVNSAFATVAFGQDEPIGKRLTFRGNTWTIVGVVADKRHVGLGAAPKPEILIPRAASSVERYSTWVVVRTSADPAALVAAIRKIVRELDPTLPVADIATMEDRLFRSVAPERFRALLVGALGVIAFALAIVGIYGITADTISRSLREIGIRVALGAPAVSVIRASAGQVLGFVGYGIALGLVLAWVVGRLVGSSIAVDLTGHAGVLAATMFAFVVTAATAAILPTRRATRIDPTLVMRD